jgi:hypothetical protein
MVRFSILRENAGGAKVPSAKRRQLFTVGAKISIIAGRYRCSPSVKW